MREKLSGFTFSIKWFPGKTHLIADALPCAPLFMPEDHTNLEIDTALSCLTMTQDPSIKVILTHIDDDDYLKCCQDVLDNTASSKLILCLKNLRS